MNTLEMVAESNRIEGIVRPPTEAEVYEHQRFTMLNVVSISEVEKFVKVYQPDARLRRYPGIDVHVGSYMPPKGGEHVVALLQYLMTAINNQAISAWQAHIDYETLHPFSDCNGRSGRALWYFSMRNTSQVGLGFLHAFYYQTLNTCGDRK